MKTTDYVGKEICLFPKDSYKKNAMFLNVDEHGYTFRITSCNVGSGYVRGEVLFFNHATKVLFSSKLATI